MCEMLSSSFTGREIDLEGDERQGRVTCSVVSAIVAGPSRHGWVRGSGCGEWPGWVRGSGCKGEDAAFVARESINESLLGLSR